MKSNFTLVSIGQFDLKLNHLLIIGILSLSFSISFLIRSQPADWGWELNEFDPFFNYRATEYLLENGLEKYFEWNDELSWYPHGRNISQSSQVMLHTTAAATYSIFAGGGNLYDFTILFPVIFGSLTCIVIFALVRVIGGTTAGLLSALLFSISLPIIIRGSIGWFKSEPLGLFFGVLTLYLFLSGIKSKNHKIAFTKLVASGIFIILGISAWGGNQFFIIPLGILFFVLPFVRNDHKFLIWAIPVFTITSLITSTGFERLGSNFIFGLGGITLLLPTLFLVSCIIIQNKSKSHKTRNGILFLIIILIVAGSLALFLINSDLLPMPSFRYLNAVNPFLTTTDPLVDSVAEHATTTIEQSFIFHSILMLFAALGIWLLLTNPKSHNMVKNDMISFSLIIGFFGVYLSSAFVRLEVLGSISIIILSSLGIAILLKYFNSNNVSFTNSQELTKKILFFAGLIILLSLPLTYPGNNAIFGFTDNPATILNGGTSFQISTTDWNDTLEWIKNNTPEDAVVGSWWDYGYWIQTKADRATLADNSTVNDHIIKKIAKIFTKNPDDAWNELNSLGSDYFVIFVAAREINAVGPQNQKLYLLEGGGEESKKQWFFSIAGEPLNKYLHSDGRSGTDYFWNETILGKMIPYNLIGYVNAQTNEQSLTYKPGFIPIYEKQIKFSDEQNTPFNLVYSSPSYENPEDGLVIGVFVYEINDDYFPIN